MSVLVLGGAGYIGSHTVYALIEKGEDVVIVEFGSDRHCRIPMQKEAIVSVEKANEEE